MILSLWRAVLLAGGSWLVLASQSDAADIPFTTYAFVATGTPTARTLPDRLANVANVKDFGATGNGVTDDYAAIRAAYDHGIVTLVATAPSSGSTITFASVPATVTTAMFAKDMTNPGAFTGGVTRVASTTATTVTLGFIPGTVQSGDTITFNLSNKGTIFFPAGTYLMSQALAMDGAGFNIMGVGSASTLVGNFSGYVLKRDDADSLDSATLSTVEKLKVINSHATGGGIQIGNCTLGAVRDCNVEANQGIQIASDRTPAPATGPLDFSIENCNVSPGAHVSGSIGIMSLANGPILNCKIIGYESGMRLYGNEGYFNVLGCYFEGNVVALDLGLSPDGTPAASGGLIVSGCWFKNNGTAIKCAASGTTGGLFSGIRIEASEAVTIGGSRPQYGIVLPDGKYGTSIFAGIIVTGQYDQYGIYLGDDNTTTNTWLGVQSVNTSSHGGLNWRMPTTQTGKFIGCNVSPVMTMAGLPSSPFEGDSYNVSDSNSAVWGATPTGGGSNHTKVRRNGTAWTVVGK